MRAMPENKAMSTLDEKAKAALDKKALFGPDIDLGAYSGDTGSTDYPGSLAGLTKAQSDTVVRAGVDVTQENRSGTFLQMDHTVIHSASLFRGLEVMSITQALEKYDWLKEYYWNAVSVDQDKYTAYAQLNPKNGYFIHALPGAKVTAPCQACLYLNADGLIQSVHNIIIADEGSELQIITGCAARETYGKGVHIGVSEFYVGKNAKINFTMIHNWAPEVYVRPRSATIVGENGTFLSNYICLNPVRSLQMYPKARLAGNNSIARYNSILYSRPGTSLDVGSRVVLSAAGSRAEIVARAISNGGNIFTRGNIRGEIAPAKAHLECKGLIMGKESSIIAIPELEGMTEGVELSHEAAIGRLNRDEIEYLMSRGLSSAEATSAIVRGFLDTSIMGLPAVLEKEIDEAIKACEKEMM